MITARLAGRVDDAVHRAHTIRAELAPLGIEVTRIKIEVEHVPEATSLPAVYIEHHVKVRITPDRITELGPLGLPHGAHLSRNAFRVLDGIEERFLTQRFPPHATRAAAEGLEAWFPEHARRAHDIDFVVRDASTAPDSTAAQKLLDGIRQVVRDALVEGDVRIIEDEIVLDSIWTYERAEGRRLSVPWLFAGAMRDAIQIDIVFREPLQDAPTIEVLHNTAVAHGYRHIPTGLSLWFASRAESLAWKLLWLETDAHPQAKDLYDAVLLAEHVALPVDLVRRVFTVKGETWQHGGDTQFVRAWHIEWEGFALEYPELATGNGDAWLDRLASMLQLVP
ncbi:nucleotidyl transferase AbiEii/AbiGii toxin family protein [Polyangium sp. y55x31]|uniref:nucleotidyl transferase AbiEii/AbiGii toxin family protein n=1 Tax=Polyangium sp. y55x31 TaxID=3042688 RepID=UPI00248251C1|nr:nucleotidyl transferase AbiEii/AbiGii toxin family protein [Polyangium sp. y55x31]